MISTQTANSGEKPSSCILYESVKTYTHFQLWLHDSNNTVIIKQQSNVWGYSQFSYSIYSLFIEHRDVWSTWIDKIFIMCERQYIQLSHCENTVPHL